MTTKGKLCLSVAATAIAAVLAGAPGELRAQQAQRWRVLISLHGVCWLDRFVPRR